MEVLTKRYEQGACVFVNFVFDGVAFHGDFDDDVELLGCFIASGYVQEGHGESLFVWVKEKGCEKFCCVILACFGACFAVQCISGFLKGNGRYFRAKPAAAGAGAGICGSATCAGGFPPSRE